MKKFLTFLMLLSTLCLSAIAADIEVNRLYHVTCKRGAWTYDGGQMKGATADATDVKQQFAFVLYDSNTYLWSQAAQHFIDTDGVAKSVLEASPIQWEDLGDGTFRFYFSDDKNINLTQGMVLIDDWNEADDGNIMTLTPVEGFSSSTVLSVLKDDISKKTYTFHITGAPEGSNAKVTYNETQYAGEETVEAVVITPAELTATDIAGYAYSITIDGTNVNVNYTALPFIQGQTYTLTLRGKSLVYDPSTGLLKTDVAATGDDAYFILNGNSADGFTFFSVAANKYFQVQDETADDAKAYAVAETEADATRYDYVGYEGGFTFKIHGTTDNYINERDNAFSTWNSGWGMNDAGGKLTFTIVEEEPVSYTEGDFYVKNEAGGKYFGFVGTSTSDGNFGPVEEADKLVCTVTQPEEGTFNIQLFGFNYVSCGSNGGFSNNKAANALQLFKVNGSSAVKATTIEEGAEYLIVGNKNGTDYALSNGTNGKTGADLRTAGIAVTITDNTISTVFGVCKWTFEHYVSTDTREALDGVYLKNGEGKFFGIGGEGDDINILDEGQTWNITPVTADLNAYTLENAEIDATKRFVNTGSHGYTSKSEDYNAKNVYFYELTDAATGTCTLVAQPELGKTYAMVIKNVNDSYAGYYAIYSGLANGKTDRGDVISLGTELPTSLTIDGTLSSSNGTITPAKALWTLTDTAEEPEPEPVFVEGTPIAAIEEFTDGATVYLQDAKFSKYIVNATTVADEPDVNCYITLEQVTENNFRLKLSNGKYLSYDPETIGNDAAAYDEEDQAKATVYTVVAQGNYWRFQFAFAENATAEQTYNIVGGSAPIITWNKPDGAIRRNFTVYKVASEEPIDPEEGFWVLASEASAPVAGKTYALKNVSKNNYASNHGVLNSFDGHVSDAVWTIETTGNTVDGAPTYYLYNKAEKAYWKNDDFEGNPGLDGYDIHNYSGTNAYWTNTKAEAMEVTILAAGSDATWRTAGAGSEGYILALNRVVPDGEGGDFYFKLGQQAPELAMEPWDEDVAWYFYEATIGEEPVGPTFPETGKAYQFKEKDSGMFLNVISDSPDNKKDVILKKTAQALYFTAVAGGYTIATEDGLYVGASPANTWNMSSQKEQIWVVEEVEGGYALRTADAGKYLGFDDVDNEGAAAYRDKNYATHHGIFEITAYGSAELTAKDKLAAAIAEAKALSTTDVPEDLVAELNNAIEMAEGVLNDAAATDADYDEARGILEHAANAVKNYVPQTAAEMFADLNAALEQARAINELNKVEGAINETTYEYELTSTVAGQVGYKTYDEVFNVAEDIAVIEYLINLAGGTAEGLEALLNEQGESIRMYTAELVDLIAAYNNAGWVLPEKDKTYIIRSAPDKYSWAFYYNEGALATAQWSTVQNALTTEYAWTCKGLEEYKIVNSDLEVESLGERVRFTNLAHQDQYLCWKGVTDNAKAGNTYWQISGKNAPLYGAMSMQAYDGSNHYKYLTLQVGTGGAGAVGSMNHGDGTSWVENSAYSSWYFFEEVDPASLSEPVGIGTVIAPADNALRFNVQGQRIAKDVRGINIVNGKKLIRK